MESGLCAQLSFSASLRDFASDDFDDFLILSGFLNSATYLSIGIDTLLDLLLVSSVVLLPSDDLGATSSAGDSAASLLCLRGGVHSFWNFPSTSCSSFILFFSRGVYFRPIIISFSSFLADLWFWLSWFWNFDWF